MVSVSISRKETTKWVLQQTSGLLVTNLDMAKRALEIAKREKNFKLKALDGWITRKKKKSLISFQMVTHTARKTVFNEDDMVRVRIYWREALIAWLSEIRAT